MPKSFNPPALTINGSRLRYTIDNEHEFDRSEVVGIHAMFPDGALSPSSIYNNHFKVDELCQTVGFGHKFNSNRQAVRFVTTLFNPNPGAVGNLIIPGSFRIEYQGSSGRVYTIVDDGAGGLVDPGGMINEASIDYATGDLDISFTWFGRPKTWYGKMSGAMVQAFWKPVTAIDYPTQWQVTRAWPNGSVKQAKAWIGMESGDPLFIPASTPIDIYVASGAGQTSSYIQITSNGAFLPNAWNGSSSSLGLFEQAEINGMNLSGGPVHLIRGTNRIIVKQYEGVDSSYNSTNLPVYTVHPELAAKMAIATSMRSEVKDNQWNTYRANVWDSNPHEENIVENPNFGGSSNQGWMKVTQRRNYHAPRGIWAHEAQRDLLSFTAYTYIPHNSRIAQVEARIANDYRGHDPYEHQFTQAVTLAPSGNTTVSLIHCHNGTWGGPVDPEDADWPCIKQCNVEFLNSQGVVVARDHYGDSEGIISVNVDGVPTWGRYRAGLENPNETWGSIDYQTGVVIIFDTAPGMVASIRYKSYTQRVGTVNGVNPTAQSFDSLPQGTDASQYSFRVRVGKTSILAEGWDAGGVLDTQVGYIAPILADLVTHHEELVGGSVTTTQAFNLGANVHPGSVKLYLAEYSGPTRDGNTRNSTWTGVTVFADDNGNGGRGRSRGVNTLSIDYATGAGSITFTVAPGASLKLFASHRRSSTATPVSGTWDRDGGANGHGQLVLSLQGTFSNDDVYISYFPNTIRSGGRYHNPNVHAIGNCSFANWQITYDPDLPVHMEGTDWNAYEKWYATNTSGRSFPSAPTTSNLSSSIYPYYQGTSVGIPTTQRIWDCRYDKGSTVGSGATAGAYGYMADGSSLYRNFFVYANNTATTADNDAWRAKKRAHIHGIPMLECQQDTAALTVYEATWQRVAPRVACDSDHVGFMNGAAWNPESINHAYGYLADATGFMALNLYPWPQGEITYACRPGEARTKFNTLWNYGRGSGPSDAGGESIRPDLRWFENYKVSTSSAGAPRINHSFVQNALFTGSNSVARYLTHAGMFTLCRAGMASWGTPDSFNHQDDLYRNYTGQDSPDGKFGGMQSIHPIWRLQQGKVGGTYNNASLRGRGRGRLYGFEGAYSGSENNPTNVRVVDATGGTVIRTYWNVPSGAVPPPVFGAPVDTFSFDTNPYRDGSTALGFRFSGGGNTGPDFTTIRGNQASFVNEPGSYGGYITRCTLEGSDVFHELKSMTYNSSGGYTDIVIDPPYPANPVYVAGVSSPLSWNLVSDCRTGEDPYWVRNDPRTFPQLRNGVYTNKDAQSDISGDVTSHQAHFAGYDAWTLTGEWSAWDQVKFVADWAIIDVKDIQHFTGPNDHWEGQQRSNMWNMRSIVQAFDATNYLNDQAAFSFLNDAGSGLSSKQRYRKFIINRIRSYVDNGLTGLMDPNSTIATGRRNPIKNITMDKSAAAADWNSCGLIGAKSPPYGDGVFTECELVYGEGFNYLSIWEFGYGTPYVGAAYRLFKDDPEVITLHTRRDLPSNVTTAGDIVWKYWEGLTNLMVGWSFIDRGCNVVGRSQPGFVRVSRQFTNLTVQPVSSGEFRFSGYPEEIGGNNPGVRVNSQGSGSPPQYGEGWLQYNGFINGSPNTVNIVSVRNISPLPTSNNLNDLAPAFLYRVASDPTTYGLVPGQQVSYTLGGLVFNWNLSLPNLLESMYEDVLPISSFPEKVFNRHYISSQVYWMRGAPRRIRADIQNAINSYAEGDRIGHPIVNAKGEEITLYGNDSTFDAADTHFPDDTVNDPIDWPPTAWHFAGESGWAGTLNSGSSNQSNGAVAPNGQGGYVPVVRQFIGGSEIRGLSPSEYTNIPTVRHPSTRPPKHAEGVNVEGRLSSSLESAFTMVAYAGLPLVAKYHPDPYIAARAGDLMNRLIYQGIVTAQVKNNRSQNGEIKKLFPIELSITAGGVTGGFPWEDNPDNINNGGNPSVATDRWSQANYFRRRQITSQPLTSDVTVDDVFVIDFDQIGIPSSEIFNGTLSDATVVIQNQDGTDIICQSKVINPNIPTTGSYKMYVRFPEGMSIGSAIGGNPISQRWYLYTSSVSGPYPTWDNQSNFNAPFSASSNTAIYWDDSAIDGDISIWRDVGPNSGWSGNNLLGLGASLAEGRHRPGWLMSPGTTVFPGIFSNPALNICDAKHPSYLGSSFTFDLSYKMTVTDLIALHAVGPIATNQNYGLVSAVQQSSKNVTYAFLVYLERQTGRLQVVYDGATAADAIVYSNRTRISGEGSLTGGTTYEIVCPGAGKDHAQPFWVGDTGQVGDTVGTVRAYVSTSGVITNYGSVDVSSVSAVDANTFTVTLDSAPTGSVYAVFFGEGDENTPDRVILPEQWNSIRVYHTGSSINLAINARYVMGASDSQVFPSFTPITIDPVTGLQDALSVGSLHSTTTSFISPARGSVADFRVTKGSLGLPKLTTSSILGLAALPTLPETLLVQNTASFGGVGDITEPERLALEATGNVVAVKSEELSLEGNIVRVGNEDLALEGSVAGVSKGRFSVLGAVMRQGVTDSFGGTGAISGIYTLTLDMSGNVVHRKVSDIDALGLILLSKIEPLKASALIRTNRRKDVRVNGSIVRVGDEDLALEGLISTNKEEAIDGTASIQIIKRRNLPMYGYIGGFSTLPLKLDGAIVRRRSNDLEGVGEVSLAKDESFTGVGALSIRVANPRILTGLGFISSVESHPLRGLGYVLLADRTSNLDVSGLVMTTPSSELVGAGSVKVVNIQDLIASGLVKSTLSNDLDIGGAIQSRQIQSFDAIGNLTYTPSIDLQLTGRVSAPAMLETLEMSGSVQVIDSQDITGDGLVAPNYLLPLNAAGSIVLVGSFNAWLPAIGSIQISGVSSSFLAKGNVKAPDTEKLYCFGKIQASTGLTPGINQGITGE